jgi:hypothetical protein
MRAYTFRGVPQYVYKEKTHGSKNEILKIGAPCKTALDFIVI